MVISTIPVVFSVLALLLLVVVMTMVIATMTTTMMKEGGWKGGCGPCPDWQTYPH